jgi:signal transduction histidine kinase
MGLNSFKKSAASERDKVRVSLALEEAERLQNLLKEILLYAKPQTLQLEELDINDFVEKTLLSLDEMPEADGRQIEFIPITPTVKILGDRDKLKQVLINLVRNACEAIASGEIVTCKVEREPNPTQICLSVHNSGTPIPENLLPKLTQPFCSGKPGGTGLGLAIVKRIVDAHGGTLSIQSDAIVGTIVRITLPVADGTFAHL